MTGKVFLVGAGPGDPGLMTVKGKEVLSAADVVVTDALLSPGILAMIPADAEVIDAGKRSGNHTIPQAEMNRILLREAQAGKTVVRLKGGDPFVFGRGGEELFLLSKNGIPFEVVPGVTSAFAVPAYNGIPVTHRDYASSVHVITGHRRAGEETQDAGIDYEALVRAGGTLVFLMGVSTLPAICEGLLSAGMDPDTPAALLERGTTADQRCVSAALSGLAAAGREAGIAAPAIIIIGEVCGLSDALSWYEKKPLSGFRVVLTRPKELISQTAGLLREKGAEVVELPTIRTQAFSPQSGLEEAWNAPAGAAAEGGGRGGACEMAGSGGADASGGRPRPCDWLVFTSPSGVRIFFEWFLQGHDLRELYGIKIASIGKGTMKALRERGLRSDFIPSVYDTKTLGEELSLRINSGDRVLIPRAKNGSAALTDALSQVPGVQIRDIAIYDTILEASALIDIGEMVSQGRIDAAVFTSASTVRGFAAAAGDMDYTSLQAVCIGKQTAAAARALGMQVSVADEATMESLTRKVEELAGRIGRRHE